jgi:hypothetical protein
MRTATGQRRQAARIRSRNGTLDAVRELRAMKEKQAG